MSNVPSPNGGNGSRDARGRFAKGNPGGPGNPYAKRVALLRSLILETVDDLDLQAIVAALVKQAKAGDVAAARELFNRLLGKPATATDPEQQELSERRLELQRQQIEATEDRIWLGS